MIKRVSILTTTFIVEFVFLQQWFLCKQFKDFLFISSTNLTLYLEDLIHSDIDISLSITRLFHNKIIGFLTVLSKYYFRFWDIRFDVVLFSIVGYFGLVLGFWYILNKKEKKWYIWLILSFLLALPLIEILFEPHLNFRLQLVLLTLPYQMFSLFGIWQFIKEKSSYRFFIMLGLITLSIWWFLVLKNDIYIYCIKL